MQRTVAVRASTGSGNVEKDIKAAEPRAGCHEEDIDLRSGRGIARVGAGGDFTIEPRHDDCGPLFAEAPRGGETDAARAADDEATFVLQSFRHRIIHTAFTRNPAAHTAAPRVSRTGRKNTPVAPRPSGCR